MKCRLLRMQMNRKYILSSTEPRAFRMKCSCQEAYISQIQKIPGTSVGSIIAVHVSHNLYFHCVHLS